MMSRKTKLLNLTIMMIYQKFRIRMRSKITMSKKIVTNNSNKNSRQRKSVPNYSKKTLKMSWKSLNVLLQTEHYKKSASYSKSIILHWSLNISRLKQR